MWNESVKLSILIVEMVKPIKGAEEEHAADQTCISSEPMSGGGKVESDNTAGDQK